MLIGYYLLLISTERRGIFSSISYTDISIEVIDSSSEIAKS